MEIKFKTISDSKIILAYKYFSILSITSDLNLTSRELDYLAYTAVCGPLKTTEEKEEFVKLHPPTSMATLNNVISKLFNKRILKKIDGVKIINPLLNRDFSKLDTEEFKIQVKCLYKEKE